MIIGLDDVEQVVDVVHLSLQPDIVNEALQRGKSRSALDLVLVALAGVDPPAPQRCLFLPPNLTTGTQLPRKTYEHHAPGFVAMAACIKHN